MSEGNKGSIDYAGQKIPGLFRKIFIPTVLGMLANVAFTITDGIFIGHGVGPEGMASVNLVAPTMLFILGIAMMFGMGSSVVAAIHMSKGENDAARSKVTLSVFSAITISLLAVVLLYCFPTGVMRMLGVSQEMMPLAGQYFFWFVPTCFFIMIQMVGSFVIRLDGSPKYSMAVTAVPSVLNIILDYTFIFPCGMGLKGAALATDIGTFTGALMVFHYMLRKARTLKFCRLSTAFRGGFSALGEIVKVGLPGFVMQLSAPMLILCGNRSFGAHLGDSGVAAFSVICYVFPLIANIFFAAATSAQPIISYNHGAGNRERVSAALRCSIIVSIAFAVLALAVFTFCAPIVISVFLKSGSETYALSSAGLPLFATGLLFMAFNTPVVGYFQSVEQSGKSILLTILRSFILIALAFAFLPVWLGAPGLWFAMPAAEFITVFAAIFCLRKR